jgi:hypothetical protein
MDGRAAEMACSLHANGELRVNLVERFFADITEKQIRRGVHRSTNDLETAIRAYIDGVNADPKPFRWTKSADDILAAIKRFCLKTLEIASAQSEIASNSEIRTLGDFAHCRDFMCDYLNFVFWVHGRRRAAFVRITCELTKLQLMNFLTTPTKFSDALAPSATCVGHRASIGTGFALHSFAMRRMTATFGMIPP